MESGEGSRGRTWMDEGMEYVKGTRRVRYGGSVKYANRVALMSRPAEAIGERLPQGCKHRAPHPLEPVGSGTLEGKCSLTRYTLSNVCSIKSYPSNHRFPPLALSCNFRLIDPPPISQILHLFLEIVSKN